MGTFGAGSFENDAVLDWLDELELDANGVALVRNALEAAADADPEEEIDVDDAQAAIAAAEIVASGRGKGDDRITDRPALAAWIVAHRAEFRDGDLSLAKKAVARVLKSSELQELWDEGGTDNDWRKGIAELLRRLAPEGAQKQAAKKKPAPKK